MATTMTPPAAPRLSGFAADLTQCSVSGLSSGAFMSVQLHLALSSMFVGAGVIAGGPYRCAESFPGASMLDADANIQTALFVCMNPLIPGAAPNPERLVQVARETAADRLIDPLEHVARQRLYIFTGSQDKVVSPWVVQTTRRFYELLGVSAANLRFVDKVPAGHAILTTNFEDNPLEANQPPFINRGPGTRMQSQDILEHLYGTLKPPSRRLGGQLLCFDQREFLDDADGRSCMSAYGFAYVPEAVAQGTPCRIHVALHGCKQGYNYVDLDNGRPDRANEPPFGKRYVTGTGYNEVADANDIVVLYPQVEGVDNGTTQNPDGCSGDWWGYSSRSATRPDYYSKHALQISAIHRMLQRLGGA